MNSSGAQYPTPIMRRGRTPGLVEFSRLLELIPVAAAVIDRSRDQIIAANEAFGRLVSLPAAEVLGRKPAELLPFTLDDVIHGANEFSWPLPQGNGPGFTVTAVLIPLDNENQWAVLKLIEVAKDETRRSLWVKVNQTAMMELAELFDEGSFENGLQRAAARIAEILEMEISVIYQASQDFPVLQRIAWQDEQNVLPESLSSTDLIRLAETVHWMPGRRVITDLHRAGRSANLTQIVSTPLGHKGALFGLLVAADSRTPIDDTIGDRLEVLGAYLTRAIQHSILIQNLKAELRNRDEQANITNELIENAREGIIILRPDFCVLRMNNAAEWILGYAAWEVLGQPIQNILIGTERLITSLEAAAAGIPAPNLGNVSLHRRNGQAFPAHIQIIPVFFDERLQAVLIYLEDQSEQEGIRIKTQQLEHRAVLGEVMAVFAHEVRNPINNISTGLQLIASRIAPGDANEDVVNRVQADCTRLTNLMESVLSFSRPLENRFEPLDMEIYLQRILDRFRPRLSRVNITSFLQVDENCPKVMGDPRTLDQVFSNLINNAIQALGENGGILGFRVVANNDVPNNPQVTIEVSDNGPGIPEEIRDHIFEPFVTTNHSKGTGLGLAITKRIITAHRGAITVNSFPGGTVFSIVLPAADGERR